MTTWALWSNPVSGVPGAPASSTGFGSPTSLGTLFEVTAPARYLAGYRYLIADTAQVAGGPGTNRFACWQATGSGTGAVADETTVTSRTLTAGDAATFVDTFLPVPVPLAETVTYAAVAGDSEQGPFTAFYWTTGGQAGNGITAGPLTAFSDLSGSGGTNPDPGGNHQGGFQQVGGDPTAAFPVTGFDSACFFVSPIITDTPGFSAALQSTDGDGVETWSVLSTFNGPGATTMRIRRPTSPRAGWPHAFLYALPVVDGLDGSFGDGMTTLQGLAASNQYNVTVIAPSFPIMPWYADNPDNLWQQEESFMVQLAAWATANLATTGDEMHYLIGFSKSGLGGQGLIFHHPDVWAACASWDFPAAMTDYDGTDPTLGATVGGDPADSYGTSANFTTRYELDSGNLTPLAGPFQAADRLWVGGYFAFQADVAAYDTLLTSLGIQHTYSAVAAGEHNWDAGWVPAALAALFPAPRLGGGAGLMLASGLA